MLLMIIWNQKITGYVTKSEAEKAKRIFNNIESNNLEKQDALKLIIEVLELDPYKIDYYQYILNNYGDRDGNIQNISNYFKMEIEDYKRYILICFFEELDFTSLNSALKSKKILIEKIDYYGYVQKEEFIKLIDNSIEKLRKEELELKEGIKLIEELDHKESEDKLENKKEADSDDNSGCGCVSFIIGVVSFIIGVSLWLSIGSLLFKFISDIIN